MTLPRGALKPPIFKPYSEAAVRFFILKVFSIIFKTKLRFAKIQLVISKYQKD